MDEISVVRKLMDEGRLQTIVHQIKREKFHWKKENPDKVKNPGLFYCLSIYDECWDCGHKFPRRIRILADLVSDSGKYVRLRCPECGGVQEYKRDSWWGDYKEGDKLYDKISGHKGEFDVADLFDATEYYLG